MKGNGRKQKNSDGSDGVWGMGGGAEQIIRGVPMFSKALLLSPPSCEREKKRAEREKMRGGRLTSRQL